MIISGVKARLHATSKESADLVFKGIPRTELSFGVEWYGTDELVLTPYNFRSQREAIEERFKEPDWEKFMLAVQRGLKQAGYKVDINGWLETADGKILKSPGYADAPKPFVYPEMPSVPPEYVARNIARGSNRGDLVKSWAIVLGFSILAGIGALSIAF